LDADCWSGLLKTDDRVQRFTHRIALFMFISTYRWCHIFASLELLGSFHRLRILLIRARVSPPEFHYDLPNGRSSATFENSSSRATAVSLARYGRFSDTR